VPPLSNIEIDPHRQIKKFAAELFAKVCHKRLSQKQPISHIAIAMQMDAAPPVLDT
jgi:hypothetical protein